MTAPKELTFVDFDGVLAEHIGHEYLGGAQWKYPIGDPIKPMIDLVKSFIYEGKDVWIFTARAYSWQGEDNRLKSIKMVEDWCLEHIGIKLPITAEKSPACVVYFDDRAVAVERNTGRLLSPIPKHLTDLPLTV